MNDERGRISLRAILKSYGGKLKDLTVLSPGNDPFRLDTARAARSRAGPRLRTGAAAGHPMGFPAAVPGADRLEELPIALPITR
jgi:hypothetical protein